MAANLHLVLTAVFALFGFFVVGLAYGQWTTRGIEVHREKQQS